MRKTRIILITGLIGALLAFFSLICILVLHFSTECDYMTAIESCLKENSPDAVSAVQENRSIFTVIISVDTLFVLAEFFVWFGLSFLIRDRSTAASLAVLIGGLAGAALDFIQNCIEFIVIRMAGPDIIFGRALFSMWNQVTVLSYLLAYAAVIVLVPAVIRKNRKSLLSWSAVLIFTAFAAAGVFIPAVYPVSFLWYVVLFAVSGAVFFRKDRILKNAE